jgi:hypothetical protein
MTVLTPSGPKTVRGEVYTPDVFGASVGLDELHDVLLGKDTGNRFKPDALFGETLSAAALSLVAQAADPSSVPIVAQLAASPEKRMRKWAAGALGVMGEKNASLRKPIEDAVKTTLRPDQGLIPDWLAKAFRQPLLLHQDASGTIHVDDKPHDFDSVRKLLKEHVRKTGDDYVTISWSPRTPDAAGNELNRLIQQELGIIGLPLSFLALPESVWIPINLEPSSGESEDTPDTEPLLLSARVLALYRLGKLTTAGNELLQVTGISHKGVRARTPSQNKSDLEEKLGHAHVVQLVAYCLAFERKMSAEDRVKATGTEQISSAAFSAASSARETMQLVLDEVDQLEAEGSPLITPAVRERAEFASRELAALVEEEIEALRDAGRPEEAKELEDRYPVETSYRSAVSEDTGEGGTSAEPTVRRPSRPEAVTPTAETCPAESGEPLPPGHEVIALYEASRLPQARKALVDWVRRSAEAVKRTETRRAIDMERKLGHSVAVNLTVYCFKLDRKARGGAKTPQELLEAAKVARETMQTVIDESKRLEAENSPLVTQRVIQTREYAERQLADLLVQEFDALRELGRMEELKTLRGQYGQLLKVHGLGD